MNRQRMGIIAVIGLTAACAAGGSRLFIGCSPAAHTGTVQQALVDAGAVATIQGPENSPSAVRAHEQIVVGYTDLRGGAYSAAGWAWSATLPPTSSSWYKCNMTVFDPLCGSVPAKAVSSTGQTQGSWLGPASLATDGNNVIYATLAGDILNPSSPTLVVVTLSTDGGRSFGQSVSASAIVNESGGDCDGGVQDLPNAAYDLTTSPATFWVVWRHKTGSSYGGCVRRGQIVSGAISWLDKTRSIANMDRENGSDANMGQGGLRIQAGDGAVTVGYSNNDEIVLCPSPAFMSIRWGTVTSLDNGASWNDRTSVYHTTGFPSCTANRKVQNSLRAFDFLRAADGNYYFVVNDSRLTLRLFHTAGVLKPSGGADAIWREYCPGFRDFDGGPSSNWTSPGATCGLSPLPLASTWPFFPTLVADGTDRIGVVHFEAVQFGAISLHAAYRGNVAQRSATSPNSFQPLTLSTNFSTPSVATTLGTCLSATIEETPRAQSCTSNAPYYAFWPFPDGNVPALQDVEVWLQ